MILLQIKTFMEYLVFAIHSDKYFMFMFKGEDISAHF